MRRRFLACEEEREAELSVFRPPFFFLRRVPLPDNPALPDAPLFRPEEPDRGTAPPCFWGRGAFSSSSEKSSSSRSSSSENRRSSPEGMVSSDSRDCLVSSVI